jgi:hypothetical protein
MGECAIDREECAMQEYQGGCHCGALGIIYRTAIDPYTCTCRTTVVIFAGPISWLAHRIRRAVSPSTSRMPPRFGTIVSRIGARFRDLR